MQNKNNKRSILCCARILPGSRRYIRTSPKAHLNLPVELQEVVIGTILGDLGVERPSPRSNTRLHFKQTDKKKEYIAHLYLLFQEDALLVVHLPNLCLSLMRDLIK